jgi:hypothetical protein
MEQYKIKTPSQVQSLTILLSKEAIEWLSGTTTDNDNHVIGNLSLFLDLLSRMKTKECTDSSFRRPQIVKQGQAQFSELQLTEQWNMGRKKIHNMLTTIQDLKLIELFNSRTASMLSFACIQDWSVPDITNEPNAQNTAASL